MFGSSLEYYKVMKKDKTFNLCLLGSNCWPEKLQQQEEEEEERWNCIFMIPTLALFFTDISKIRRSRPHGKRLEIFLRANMNSFNTAILQSRNILTHIDNHQAARRERERERATHCRIKFLQMSFEYLCSLRSGILLKE